MLAQIQVVDGVLVSLPWQCLHIKVENQTAYNLKAVAAESQDSPCTRSTSVSFTMFTFKGFLTESLSKLFPNNIVESVRENRLFFVKVRSEAFE